MLDGRLTRGMCEKRIFPDSFIFDGIDWHTYGEKQGEWLQRYSGLNQKQICWGDGASADKWFDSMLAGEGCDRPWMVMSEEDVPKSRFQQYAQEAPAVMGLDPLILEFCRNLTHDSRPVPHVDDPFWKTWEAAGMPAPEKSLGPFNTLEYNLLQACGAANRNILRVSAVAQATTSWDMCANVEWVVCAAKGKLPNQGKTIEFSTPPGSLDGHLAPTYREYRSNILRSSANYEIDMMAWTYYVNEICFLSELCDNADELWSLKRGEPWVCKHTPAGEQRLKDSLKNAYDGVSQNVVHARMLSGGHVGGGHIGGGHIGGGHIGGGHIGGGHIGGGHIGVLSTTATTTTTTVASVVTKVAGTIKVVIEIQDNMTQEVLETMFKKGIAQALSVSIEDVVKLTVSEVGQGRRLLSNQAKQYEVSYEIIAPTSMDADLLVEKANRITEANSTESQAFRQVLIAQDGVSKVLDVTVLIAAYKFEEQITTTASSKSKEPQSGMSGGVIVLIIFAVLLVLGGCLIAAGLAWRKRLAPAGARNNTKDARQSPGTLLRQTGAGQGEKKAVDNV